MKPFRELALIIFILGCVGGAGLAVTLGADPGTPPAPPIVAQAGPAAAEDEGGSVRTARFMVVCPSASILLDVDRSAAATTLAYVNSEGCRDLDEGVRVNMIEHGPLVSRVLLTHLSGHPSVSTDAYFARTVDLTP